MKKRSLKAVRKSCSKLWSVRGVQVLPKFGVAVAKSKQTLTVTASNVTLPKAEKLRLRVRDPRRAA